MDYGETDFGSTVGEDAPEQPECGAQTEVDEVQDRPIPIIGDMTSFTSVRDAKGKCPFRQFGYFWDSSIIANFANSPPSQIKL